MNFKKFKQLQDLLKNEYSGLEKIGILYDFKQGDNSYQYLNIKGQLVNLEKNNAGDGRYDKIL